MNKFKYFLNSAKEIVTKRKQQEESEFNSFMVPRILSMDQKYLNIISEIQFLLERLPEKRQRALLFHLLPKQEHFFVKYITKNKMEKTNNNE